MQAKRRTFCSSTTLACSSTRSTASMAAGEAAGVAAASVALSEGAALDLRCCADRARQYIHAHTHTWTQASGTCWPSKPIFLAGTYTIKLSLHCVADALRQLLATIADIELTNPGTALPSTKDTAPPKHTIHPLQILPRPNILYCSNNHSHPQLLSNVL